MTPSLQSLPGHQVRSTPPATYPCHRRGPSAAQDQPRSTDKVRLETAVAGKAECFFGAHHELRRVTNIVTVVFHEHGILLGIGPARELEDDEDAVHAVHVFSFMAANRSETFALSFSGATLTCRMGQPSRGTVSIIPIIGLVVCASCCCVLVVCCFSKRDKK